MVERNAEHNDAERQIVVDRDGDQGFVESPSGSEKVTVHYNDRRIVLPATMLVAEDDGHYRLSSVRLEELATWAGDTETVVIPVIAEEARVGKREVETGIVRLHKTVSARREHLDVPLLRDVVDVRRVAKNDFIETPHEVRTEGETTIVPVMEEVLVLERRLLLKEELHITRRQEKHHEQHEVELRREDVRIERIDPRESPSRNR